MITHGESTTDFVSTEHRRSLRPRQAPGARGTAAGGETAPRAAIKAGGRVTRSSAGAAVPIEAFSVQGSSAPPPRPRSSSPTPTRNTRSHKRVAPPGAPRASANRLSKRRRHQSGFYDEDSNSEEDLDIGDLDLDLDLDDEDSEFSALVQPISSAHDNGANGAPRALRSRARPSPAKRRHTAAPAARNRRHVARPVKRAVGKSRPAPQPDTLQTVPNPENAVIPDWASLPYHVWVQIFQHAFAALESGSIRSAVNWLLSTSRVARAVAEPALTILYYSPPLLTRSMAHKLVSHLSQDPSTTMFNYRPKVKKLSIDVEEIAAKMYSGSPLDLKSLIGRLPQLKVIDFYHRKDEAPYRSLDENLRWHYPAGLFEALDVEEAESDTYVPRLAGWRWNRRMMGQGLDLAKIKTLHMVPSFRHLKRLSLVNYQIPSLHAATKEDDEEAIARDQAYIQSVADAISVLPDLEYLSIETSTVVTDDFLLLLPKTLRTLSLINCWEVTGPGFATYLVSHGQALQNLTLNHCQSLDLSFLAVLGSACPNLQNLCADLKYYNHHEYYNDSDPLYKDVLTVNQIPDWPAALELIDLRNMRKWSAEAAEVFFQSLVDSAAKLSRLRALHLKAMLDIPIRQRSEIRDKWDARLKEVFLRKKTDPLPLFSLRDRPIDEEVSPLPKSRRMAVESPSRRSTRIVAQLSNPSSRASSVGRDLRIWRARPSYAEPDTDDEDLEAESDGADHPTSSDEGDARSPTTATDGFIQGLCDTVEIQLDNQKPTEEIFEMNDFMDESDSDDSADEDYGS